MVITENQLILAGVISFVIVLAISNAMQDPETWEKLKMAALWGFITINIIALITATIKHW